MSDRVGNPEDRLSLDTAHYKEMVKVSVAALLQNLLSLNTMVEKFTLSPLLTGYAFPWMDKKHNT